MIRVACILVLALALSAGAADVTVHWDYPTTNVTGEAMTDLVATRVTARDAILLVTYSNEIRRVGAALVTNRVIVAWTWTTGAVVQTQQVRAWTNAPAAVCTDAVTLTGLVQRVYDVRARAINAMGEESVDSDRLLTPAGTPSTVKMRLQK